MKYPFFCPKCGNKVIISMPIKEAHNDGHYCAECGEELQREVKSLVCAMSVDSTNTFYRKIN
jgi:transcription elongation factor Elf1